jgi:hypothetical protein
MMNPLSPTPRIPGSNESTYSQVPQQPTCTREKKEKKAESAELPVAVDVLALTLHGSLLEYDVRPICKPTPPETASITNPLSCTDVVIAVSGGRLGVVTITDVMYRAKLMRPASEPINAGLLTWDI